MGVGTYISYPRKSLAFNRRFPGVSVFLCFGVGPKITKFLVCGTYVPLSRDPFVVSLKVDFQSFPFSFQKVSARKSDLDVRRDLLCVCVWAFIQLPFVVVLSCDSWFFLHHWVFGSIFLPLFAVGSEVRDCVSCNIDLLCVYTYSFCDLIFSINSIFFLIHWSRSGNQSRSSVVKICLLKTYIHTDTFRFSFEQEAICVKQLLHLAIPRV